MKIVLATLWLLVPLGFAAFHFGPGQKHMALDQTENFLSQGRRAASNEDWPGAIDAYQDALAKLPKDELAMSRRLQLEIAKAKMQASALPEAREELAGLVEGLNNDPTAPADLKEDALSALANSRYYMTYLMKLEGLPATEWEPEIEAARQEYKLLAQIGSNKERHLADLEAAIRLARTEASRFS